MPSTISSNLQTHIQQDVTTLATCIRITREDDEVFAFTSHQRDLVIDGVTYRAGAGMYPTAFQATTKNAPDNQKARLFFEDDAITEADVRGGKFENAEMLTFVVNYKDLTMGKRVMGRGYLGKVSIYDNGSCEYEFQSLSERLNQEIGDLTSVFCRVRRLGDSQCLVNLSGNTVQGVPITTSCVVDSVTSNRVFVASELVGRATNLYLNGWVAFTGGENDGIEMEISSSVSASGQLTLMAPMPFTVAVNDTFNAIVGCDRLVATCKDRFNNVNANGGLRFRGEPYIVPPERLGEIDR